MLPDRYRATARVQVDTTSALKPLLGNQIVTASVEQHVAFVQQALLGSVQLSKVARDTGLDVNVENELGRQELLSGMRDRISISSSNIGRQNAGDNLYVIEFEHEVRETAINVVDVLLNNFIEDTLGANRDNNEAARTFIDQQITDNERRLREAEDRLADFKKRNADRLPGSEGGYFSRLQDAKDRLSTLRRDIRIERSKRESLTKQLSGESQVVGGLSSTSDDDPPENSLDARIRNYESQLETLLLDYTERHPDVIAMRQTVDRLKAEREEELRKLGIEGANLELAMLDDNPVRQAIRISLNETEVTIAILEADIADQEVIVSELQALIDEVPEVEAELARLNRDYEVIYNGYQGLVQSRETQELSSRAYSSDEVDFEVIDPPTAGFDPVAPRRAHLFVFATIFAFGVSGGAAFVLSQLNPVYHDSRSISEIAGIPVLGAITNATGGLQRFVEKREFKVVTANVVAIGVTFAVLLGFEILGSGIRSSVEALM